MNMSPAIRKLVLAVHLTRSAGWLGAVVAYLALDLTVATSVGAVLGDSLPLLGDSMCLEPGDEGVERNLPSVPRPQIGSALLEKAANCAGVGSLGAGV
jgi:hypothetical protein